MACTHKNKTPSDIISREEMTSLVWDVMLVDQYSQEYELGDSVKNRKAERSRLYQEVFDLHKTSRKDFLKSFNYYLSRPDLTKIIFDTLAARGSRERERSFRIKKPAK
jgi:hypothetical protein